MLIFIIVLVGLVWLFVSASKRKKQRDAENATFAGEHQGWDIYMSAYDRGVIAINHDSRRIAVGTVRSNTEKPWSDISAVEIESNGQSIVQTNRGSQVAGAAIGGLLLGPVGLLLGGVSGSKRQKQRVNELSIKILIDDRTAPVHRIKFFRMSGNGVDAKSSLLARPTAMLEHYHALIANAIRADTRSLAGGNAALIGDQTGGHELGTDIYSELSKLSDLKDRGIITDAEFTAHKTKLLA